MVRIRDACVTPGLLVRLLRNVPIVQSGRRPLARWAVDGLTCQRRRQEGSRQSPGKSVSRCPPSLGGLPVTAIPRLTCACWVPSS